MKTSKYAAVAFFLAVSFTVPAFSQAQVMCTQEAMQCPDGSWVGRSGPNCQFVCPGTPALPTVPPYYQPAPICPQLSYNLYRGLSDYYTQGQVTQLQQFLSTRYYQPVTGYFGSMTAANVAQFQREQSVYPITGGVGPLTRAAIARVCGGTPYPNPIPTYNAPSISGISGPTQLSVGQSGTWQVSVNDQSGSLSYSVVWGDEQQYGYGLNVSTSASAAYSGSLSHTYSTAGTYTPRFTVTNAYGQSANASASVVVSGSGCGAYYWDWNCPPPATTPTLNSLSPSQGTVGTTITIYGSGFTGSNVVHFGVGGKMQVPSYNNGTLISYTIPSSVSPCDIIQTFAVCAQYLQQVTPGAYQIYVSNSNGQSAAQTFTVTGSSSGSVSAYPQSGYAPLTVTFSVNNYSGLYSVSFGDGTSATLQSGAVTHTYYTRGTFTAQFASDHQCLHGGPVVCEIAVQNLGSATVTVY